VPVFTLNDKSNFLHKLLDRQSPVTLSPTAFRFNDSSFEDVALELTNALDEEDIWKESPDDIEAFVATLFPDNLVVIDRYVEENVPHFFIEISGPDLYFTLDIAYDHEVDADEEDAE